MQVSNFVDEIVRHRHWTLHNTEGNSILISAIKKSLKHDQQLGVF